MYTDTKLVEKIDEIKSKFLSGEHGLNVDDFAFLLSVANAHPVAQLVRFHQKYTHTTNELPVEEKPAPTGQGNMIGISLKDFELRKALIEEEFEELMEAMDTCNLVEIYDAYLDIIYVAYGGLLTMGLPGFEGHNEVHHSNMSKSTEKTEAGKTIKGDDYFKPRLNAILEAVKYNAKQNQECNSNCDDPNCPYIHK